MISVSPVVGGPGNASVAPVQIDFCGSLPQPGRPDSGRAQATRSSGYDRPEHLYVADYDRASGDDLRLFQADKITFAEWNRRQSEHCQKYHAARASQATGGAA